ncbi:Glycerol-3-phosphate dehydrogenase [Ceratobasidium theobromae]|uniref:Glycerol-3-phosphate dehydrogenase n=1 Tax=Ceratobasidium theobromae TaxID=1582974 RepID=A0A5N5QW23_9AGAM|nr:Glycerol-3-phosphate dehydrogenase [Ceratobasidium theobromae]
MASTSTEPAQGTLPPKQETTSPAPVDTGDQSTIADAPRKKDARFWLIFVALCVSTFLSALELTSVSTALPTIVEELKGHEFAWIGSAYTLGSTAFMPMSGGLAEIFGRRSIMITSLVIFAIGSAVCGAAPNMSALIAGRTIQGIGGGGILTLTDIIVADLVPLADRGPYLGIVGAVWAVASAIGPPVGGAFAETNWRWLFYINLPISGVAMVLVLLFLRLHTPTESFSQKIRRIDWIGNFLVIGSTTSTIIALTWAGAQHPWKSYQVLVPLLIGLSGLAATFVYEFNWATEPILPRQLLWNRTSLSGYLGTFVHGLLMVGIIYYLPIYFQAVKGVSPIKSGIDMFGIAFTVAPFAILTGISTVVFNRYRPQNYVAWVIITVGLGLLSMIKADSSKASWVGYQVIIGIGGGILYASTNFPILAPLPVSLNASALALLAFIRTFAGTYGVAIGSSVLQTELGKRLPSEFSSLFPGGTDIAFSAIPFVKGLEEPLRSQVRVAFAESLAVLWRVFIGISGAGFLSVLLMKEVKMSGETDEKWGMERTNENKDAEKHTLAIVLPFSGTTIPISNEQNLARDISPSSSDPSPASAMIEMSSHITMLRRSVLALRQRRTPLLYASAAATAVTTYYVFTAQMANADAPEGEIGFRKLPARWDPPTRAQMIKALQTGKRPEGGSITRIHPGDDTTDEFDLLIVGGGATGAGVAVDAVTRGLKVALIERDDFSSGTSSKSTKLVHGGVRYLQKAVFELDYEQYKLVREALHERRVFLHTAPYLSHPLPIMLPLYKYWQVPYYYAGCKMYDALAGSQNMETSYLMSRGKALEAFPMLKREGLVGAVVYYDGQHNDSRMNVALVMTAVLHGAVAANHVSLTALTKDASGKIIGGKLRDEMTGKEWKVKAKGVINATGPFTDAILQMDAASTPGASPQAAAELKPIVSPSSGVHITLPNYYSPRTMGLIDPSTSDGRVLFFLPWQGNTIAGTTDSPSTVEHEPLPKEEDIRWILEEVRRYLSPDIKVRRGDVLSAWSGIRPLVRDPAAKSTEGLVRNHMINVSDSGLVTIAGGKWTTYRAMAEETVDRAIKTFGLGDKAGPCVTEKVRLVGSDSWSKNMFIGLIQRYGLETDVAKHLSSNYGDRAYAVCEHAVPTGQSWPIHGKRLAPAYPFIEAEIRYAVHNEYAQTATDFLARRSRLAFLNAQAAFDVLPRVVTVMGEELGWDAKRRRQEIERTSNFLVSMGLFSAPEQAKTLGVSRLAAGLGVSGAGAAGQGGIAQMVWSAVTGGTRGQTGATAIQSSGQRSRASFSFEELEALRRGFEQHSTQSPSGSATISLPALHDVVHSLPSYSAVRDSDITRALEETAFQNGFSLQGLSPISQGQRQDKGETKAGGLSYEDFLDVVASVKEVSLTPESMQTGHVQRRRIPVERSGGGV